MTQANNTPSSGRSRLTQRIPAITNMVINDFATDNISNYAGRLVNARLEYYKNDQNRPYVTQRPSLTIIHDASATVADTKGRGSHYWNANGNHYFMNDDIIYKQDYAGPCSVQGGDTAITSGSQKVYFIEWSSANSTYLFILDPENNGVYVINDDADTTVINIADRSGSGTLEGFTAGDSWDFDTLNSALALGLCHGYAALDTYLFIGTTSPARIYNSNVDDWLNWGALDFTSVERENDMLLYIDKTKDHIAAIGERSTEFFYDNGNATGSPLLPRTDVAYRIGTPFGTSCWGEGDDIHFLSVNTSGEFELATLRDFQIVPHTSATMNAFLWMSRYTEDLTMTMSGFSVGGHAYVVLTSLEAGVPTLAIVYDEPYDAWSEWTSDMNSIGVFHLMGYAPKEANNENRPNAILGNGDVIRINDAFRGYDNVQAGANTAIPVTVVVDNFDGGTSQTKFMHSLNFVGNNTQAAQTFTVAWTDDNGLTSSSNTLDLLDRTQINRMGKFVNRKFTFTWGFEETLRFEGVDVTFSQGDY